MNRQHFEREPRVNAGEFYRWQSSQEKKNFERPFVVSLIRYPVDETIGEDGEVFDYGAETLGRNFWQPAQEWIGLKD
ncbi:MAG: hypothetical protein EOO27_24860 [Comamonadaceae bacterium]|nr:MAG: hypothetical protein EOO27_24860 [Comamonadaceae bacterium]